VSFFNTAVMDHEVSPNCPIQIFATAVFALSILFALIVPQTSIPQLT
jgi:hypothetical protein